jgi:GTP-binding protein YchF
MFIGIIGLPVSGKTTVFQTLAGSDTPATRAGGKLHTRIVSVPDSRLQVLAEMSQSRKITPATMTFADPVLTGQHSTRAYVENLLPLLRDADALAHVVRAFDDPVAPHVQGNIDPLRDLSNLNSELLLADLMVLEGRLERLGKDLKKMKNAELEREHDLLQRCQASLEEGQPLRCLDLNEAEVKALRGFGLLTSKAQLVVLNLDEEHMAMEPEYTAQLTAYCQAAGDEVMALYGKIEGEIAELAPQDAATFLAELGLQQSGLDRFIRASYSLLGLCSFLTTGEKETRAWTIPQGATAVQAAAAIHSDISRGFIRAETVHYDALTRCGSYAKAREAGVLRLEGKDYIVADGDVMLFRFNV